MKKLVLIIIAVLVLFFIGFYFIGVYTTNSFIEERAEELAASVNEKSAEKFHYSEIDSLPLPVQNYFRFAVKEGTVKPRFVRLRQSGKFKTNIGADFKNLTAVQYFTTTKPGFIWAAEIDFADFIWIKGIDTYFEGEGNLLIKFMSGITISNEGGKEITQSQIARWLMEAVWYPTILLPSENLSWSEIDSSKAKLNFMENDIAIEAVFYFNADGSVDKITTQRYMTTTAGPALTNYTGYLTNYKEVDGITLPHHVEVEWNLDHQDFKYGVFDIDEIEFDNFTVYDNQ